MGALRMVLAVLRAFFACRAYLAAENMMLRLKLIFAAYAYHARTLSEVSLRREGNRNAIGEET